MVLGFNTLPKHNVQGTERSMKISLGASERPNLRLQQALIG